MGVKHTAMLEIVYTLGDLYLKQDKLKEAEEMYLRALTDKEKIYDVEHPSTLNIVHSLGNLYCDQDKMKEAEKMYLPALTGYEKTQGPDHKSTLSTRFNLGLLYKKRSMFEDATYHFRLVVQGRTSTLEPEHPKTVNALDQLKICDFEQSNRRVDTFDTIHASNSIAEPDRLTSTIRRKLHWRHKRD